MPIRSDRSNNLHTLLPSLTVHTDVRLIEMGHCPSPHHLSQVNTALQVLVLVGCRKINECPEKNRIEKMFRPDPCMPFEIVIIAVSLNRILSQAGHGKH